MPDDKPLQSGNLTEGTPDAQVVSEGSSTDLPVLTGTQVNYFFVCRRKLWLFSHHVALEMGSDLVYQGKLLHEHSYDRARKKNLGIDNKIVLDFYEDGKVHEVKKSDRLAEAHTYQLLYYLYYLKLKGVDGVVGELNYPKLKKKVEVRLTPEAEAQLLQIMGEVQALVASAKMPPVVKVPHCRKCAYAEFCYS